MYTYLNRLKIAGVELENFYYLNSLKKISEENERKTTTTTTTK